MKARLLTKILNDTKYTVNNNTDYIAVGSPLCHDLIKVYKGIYKIVYALDTWNEGRSCLLGKRNSELLFIWDKLQELIDNGQIKDIIEGNDEIENPLPVFTARDGDIVRSFTDKYGWPNTTIEGEIMYDNAWFKTEKEAICYGIEEHQAGLEMLTRRRDQIQAELDKVKSDIENELACYHRMTSLLKYKLST